MHTMLWCWIWISSMMSIFVRLRDLFFFGKLWHWQSVIFNVFDNRCQCLLLTAVSWPSAVSFACCVTISSVCCVLNCNFSHNFMILIFVILENTRCCLHFAFCDVQSTIFLIINVHTKLVNKVFNTFYCKLSLLDQIQKNIGRNLRCSLMTKTEMT